MAVLARPIFSRSRRLHLERLKKTRVEDLEGCALQNGRA